MSGFVKAGKTIDFPDLRTIGVVLGEKDVCIARSGQTFYAFENQCTHAASQLSDCEIEEGEEISCPLHGAKFSIKTGQALTLPAVEPVQTYEVKIEGDEVWVKI